MMTLLSHTFSPSRKYTPPSPHIQHLRTITADGLFCADTAYFYICTLNTMNRMTIRLSAALVLAAITVSCGNRGNSAADGERTEMLYAQYLSITDCDSFTVIRNAGEFMQFASVRLGGKTSEHLEFYFLDKACRVRRIYTFTDHDPHKEHVRPEELVKLISVSRPNGIYMAHNHVNNPCEPSEADDDMTKKVQLICSINNVRLYDHCILAPDGVFSYFMSNRLDEIAHDYSVGVFFNGKPVTDKF